MSNHIPSASNGSASTLEDTGYVLTTSDFNFSDADGDLLQSVAISTLPEAGFLQLRGSRVFDDATISAADIAAGYLILMPAADASGADYASFGFKVSDGADWSEQAFFNLSVTAENDAPTFMAGSGKVTTSSYRFLKQFDVAIQADGHILMMGSNFLYREFSVASYNRDGSINTNFGYGSNYNGDYGSNPSCITVQADGKILLGGSVYNYINNEFAVSRFNSDGSSDVSFGTNGILTTDFGRFWQRVQNIAVQTDGKIVATGYSSYYGYGSDSDYTDYGSHSGVTIARYNSDGTPDGTFGDNGKVSSAFGSEPISIEGTILQSDGKIIVASHSGASGTDLTVARYNSDGSVDTGFGQSGKFLVPSGGDIAIQHDGKILVVDGLSDLGVARYDDHGDLDVTFGDAGIAATYISTDSESSSIAVQADGKIIVAGYVSIDSDYASYGADYDFAMVRYNTDGTLDSGFGNNGKVTTSIGGNDKVNAVTVQADGKILLSGSSLITGSWNDNFAMARYNDDGTPDLSFGMVNSLDGAPSYPVGHSPVILDADVTIHDAELAAQGHYGGSTLTLARHDGANPSDLFSAADNWSFAGGDMALGATRIGTVVNGGGTLSITFNSNATQALVDGALHAIAYSNDGAATFTNVQIDWSFDDGSGAGNATVAGSTTITITPRQIVGTAGDDNLFGTDDVDILDGGAGNDYLDGGASADTLVGGSGDDIYVVDNSWDTVVETDTTTSEIDEVRSSVTYWLGDNVERLTLTGIDPIAGIGNTLPNLITGNAGDNQIYGGLGADTMLGGAGNDTYAVDDLNDVVIELNGEGIDRIFSFLDTYSLADVPNVENLTYLSWSSVSFTGTGNELDNTITGGYLSDTLAGGAGNDTFVGGGGNDIIDGGTGIDTVILSGNRAAYAITKGSAETVSIRYVYHNEVLTLTAVERVQFADYLGELTSADLLLSTATAGNDVYVGGGGNDVFDGLAGDDTISGNDGWDGLYGGPGNDYLDGGAQPDWLEGGSGNDIYVVDDAGDVVIETGGAPSDIDEVRSSATYTLSENVERLTLTGGEPINGYGNALPNLIKGNAGDNLLDGSAGADTLEGGAGNDTYVVDSLSDVVTESKGAGTDTIQTSLSTYSLAALANVENLTYLGYDRFTGAGNALNNVISGGNQDDTLSGGAGDDTLIGGLGNNVIDGGTGSDTVVMAGYRANYVIARPSSTSVTISSIYGWNKVTLKAVEHVQFTDYLGDLTPADLLANTASSGNDVYVGGDGDGGDIYDGLAGNDTISGKGGWDRLSGGAGDDYLDGGADVDMLDGGAGNDIYVVDNGSDQVVETSAVATEIDEVRSSVTYWLPKNVERLTLTGSDPIFGIGNELPNLIKGNAGDNLLDGSAGADTMEGGAGNDSYAVDSLSDVVTESKDAGTDTIQTSLPTYSLAAIANVENLIFLEYDRPFTGTGNDLNNVISGGGQDDTLSGGAGGDILIGGAGNNVLDGGSGIDTAVFLGNHSNYSVIQTATGYTVTAHAGESEATALSGIERLVFADAIIALLPAGVADDEVLAGYRAIAQKFYISYFGRPADPGGLQSMTDQLSAAHAPYNSTDAFVAAYGHNATVTAIIDSFGTSAESAALYNGSTTEFVTAIYDHVLGRAPDSDGLAFWSGAIDDGTLARGAAALNIMAGAENNKTVQGLIDAALLANRVTVAANFTATIDTVAETAGYSGNAAAAAVRSMLDVVNQNTSVFDFQTTLEDSLLNLTGTIAHASAQQVTTHSGYVDQQIVVVGSPQSLEPELL